MERLGSNVIYCYIEVGFSSLARCKFLILEELIIV